MCCETYWTFGYFFFSFPFIILMGKFSQKLLIGKP